MRALTSLKGRLATRPDSEHEQAILRIAIVGLIWAYMGLFADPVGGKQHLHELLVAGLGVFFAIAIALFICILVWPAPNVPRRILGMLSDTGGATFYMCLGEEYGASMLAIYLFVTFGNGFRFGRKHLFICQAFALVGLTAVVVFVPFWQEHKPIGIGLLISLAILPLYVSTLLKRIHEARQRAEEANQAKTSFLANMSHEMRTPLNGIVGVADLLTTTSLTHQQSELVSLLRNSVKVLRSLVDDVLDITKIEAGRLTIETIAFDVHHAVLELVDVLRPQAEAKNLKLTASFGTNLNFRLRGDAHHLRQVLLNLLGNAIKFTDRGEVSVRVTKVAESKANVSVRFEVRDTGIGIPAATLGRIFDRFVQADQTTTRRFGGTGLGTTIAKQLVEHMGGTIGVESTVGEGSIFWFELPLTSDLAEPFEPGGEDSGGVTVIIAEPRRATDAIALFEGARERCSVVNSMHAASTLVADLRKSGQQVRSIAAFAASETAEAELNAITSIWSGKSPALILLKDDGPSESNAYVTNSAVTVLSTSVAPNIIANTIHAATLSTYQSTLLDTSLESVLGEAQRVGTILVADDNITNQAIVRELLVRAGYRVVLADDGEQALDLYETVRPNLALLDFNMPHRTGCEVIKAIRQLEAPNERMPAIVLSASVTPESRESAIRSGADAFVGKPFEANILLRTIDQLVQSSLGSTANTKSKSPTLEPSRARSAPPLDKALEDSGATAAASQSLVSWHRISQLEDIAMNQYFVAELLRGFKDDSERLLIEIQLTVETHDRIALSDSLHALKGAAVGVGAKRLAEECKSLELALRSDDCPGQLIDQCPRTMRQTYEMTLAELNAYMLKKHNVSLESH